MSVVKIIIFTISKDHEFGFREEHGAVEQGHRVVCEIKNFLEKLFSRISGHRSSFRWHKGLLKLETT